MPSDLSQIEAPQPIPMPKRPQPANLTSTNPCPTAFAGKPPMPSPVLEVKNLHIEFPTRRGVLKADDVSFSIAPGEVLGVVGESGAGKIADRRRHHRLLELPGRVASGQILLNGQRIDNLPYEQMRKIRGRQIGAIFQDPLTSLNPLYTVGGNWWRRSRRIWTERDTAPDRAIKLLEEVGIPARERIDHYPHQFSGGMRQRWSSRWRWPLSRK